MFNSPWYHWWIFNCGNFTGFFIHCQWNWNWLDYVVLFVMYWPKIYTKLCQSHFFSCLSKIRSCAVVSSQISCKLTREVVYYLIFHLPFYCLWYKLSRILGHSEVSDNKNAFQQDAYHLLVARISQRALLLGGLHARIPPSRSRHLSWTRHSPDQTPPKTRHPPGQTPPWTRHPPSRHPPRLGTPMDQPPPWDQASPKQTPPRPGTPLWTESQTRVKT